MKLTLTPGVKFLLPALITVAALLFGATLLGVPLLVSVVAILAATPVLVVLRVLRDDFMWRRAAFRAGAQLPPRVLGAQWGNWDVLKIMLKTWDEGYMGDYMVDQVRALGSLIDMHVLWTNLFVTTSPQHIHLMLATDFANFEKGPAFQKSWESVLGQGVFNSDGDMWKFHRSMTRPFFSRDRITHFELFNHHADIAISLMKERFRAGHAIDFQDLILRFTVDSATQFLFGTCVNSLAVPLPYPHNVYRGHSQETQADNAFTQALLQAQNVLIDRQRKGWIWPLDEIRGDRTAEPMKVIGNFIEPIIASALEKKNLDMTKAQEIDDDDTLLDHLVKVTSDPKVIRDETLNILLAGRDTSGMALTLVIYFLSMYPATMARLREEILDKVGPERQPTFADIKDMKFLRAVINETLRLYPLVPFNIRESINATTFPADDPTDKPYYIPKRTGVAYSVFLMHRRTDLWGPDAEEFDPDRFLDARLQKYLLPNPFIFLPFNAGPRICPGQQFAYNEVSFMLVRLLQNFSSFSLVEDAFPPSARPPKEWATCPGRKGIEKFWPKANLILYSVGGMWIKGTEVEETSE
ncbi:cytochrome P450 monooxygenase pc-2 [Mucidula mucida]|nr:cytochrome P450 monooxygenase pc-2 [Mucidula mucida]